MKAWVLRVEEGLSWPEIRQRTTNVLGETAGTKAVREAVARIEQHRADMKLMWDNLMPVAEASRGRGGRVALEWPSNSD